MPLIVYDRSFFPFIVCKALYSRAVIEVLFGLWLVLAYRYPSYRLPRSWLLLAFGIWLGISLLAALTGVSIQRSLWSTYERMQGVVDLAHWFAFALVLTSVFRSWLNWRVLLNVMLVVGLVMALMGLNQHYELGIPLFYDFLERTPRIDITLGNPSYVGAYMLVNVLIGLGLLCQSYVTAPELGVSRAAERRRRRRRRARGGAPDYPLLLWRLFWLLAIALGSWMVLLSGTRGAFIGLSAGLVTFAVGSAILRDWWRVLWVTAITFTIWALTFSGAPVAIIGPLAALVAFVVGEVLWGGLRSIRLAALMVIAGLVLGGLLTVLAVIFVLVFARDTVAYERISDSNIMAIQFSSTGLDSSSVTDRLASQSAGLEGFIARPILGWGPENYVIAWGRYFDADPDVGESFDQAHNKPIEELTTKGILGFLSYMALWVLMLWIVLRRVKYQDASRQVLTLFIAAALAGYFVQNLFLFDTPATVLQFILLLAFVVNLETTFDESVTEPSPDSGDGSEVRPGWGSRLLAPLGVGWGPLSVLGRIPRSDTLAMYGLVVVLALVSLNIYYFSYRPYSAATAVAKTFDPTISWDQRFGYFEESIDAFPPLANYPRLILVYQLVDDWDNLAQREVTSALEIVERESVQALRDEPQSWRINVALTRFFQQASSLAPAYLERARTHLTAANELAPETDEVFKGWILQQMAERDFEAAYEPVARYIQQNSQATGRFIALWGQIDMENLTQQEVRAVLEMVEREARQAVKGDPEEWRTYLALALLYQRASALDSEYLVTARSIFNEARQLAPETVEISSEGFLSEEQMQAVVHNDIGVDLQLQGKLHEAIDEFDRALKLDPSLAMAYMNRGMAYLDLGQPQRAIEDLDQAIKLDPKDADIYLNRGFAYHSLGQFQRAIQDFDEAIRINP